MNSIPKLIAVGVCLTVFSGWAQDWEPPTSRADELRRAVQEKEANLAPEQESKIENLVDRINRGIIETMLANQAGFGIKVGGLMSGSGFAMGPQYRRNDLANESIRFQASLVGSLRRYWAAEMGLAMPRLFGSTVDLELGARHSDSPSISYFGTGSDSRRSGRTSYRREDTELRLGLAWRPMRRRWLLGLDASVLKLNVGPGRDLRFRSAEEVYGPEEAVGIDRQSHYATGGAYIAYDSRDRAGLPHRGGRYMAQVLQYWDRSGGNYSFRRVRFSAEQYLPFLNEKRVIALRMRTDLSFARSGDAVPFYLQPTIGGPDDVRGLDRFRYQANNSTVFNAEYRWEVAPTLDMALFADAGNVYARPGLIGFRELKTAAGIGFRVKTRDSVVVRMDAGASKEGFRLWVTFGNVF